MIFSQNNLYPLIVTGGLVTTVPLIILFLIVQQYGSQPPLGGG